MTKNKTRRQVFLEEQTRKTQEAGNTEAFEYIDESLHLHVRYNPEYTYCSVALIYRGETITRSEFPAELLPQVKEDYRKAYAHDEEEETA